MMPPGQNNGAANPCFGGNVNEVLREDGAGGLLMRAEAGGEPTLDKPVTIMTAANMKALHEPPPDRPKNLTVEVLDGQLPRADKLSDPAHTVIWLEEAASNTSGQFMRAAQEAVRAGATLLLSGKTMPLLEAYASWTRGKPVAEVINVDQIESSNMPGNMAVMQVLEELLPARFSGIRAAGDASGDRKAVEYENMVLQAGATQSRASDGTQLLTRPIGKGKVVVAAAAVLEPAQAGFNHQRQLAYAFVCGLVGASYTSPSGLQHPKAPGFGTLGLAVLAEEITVLPAAEHRNDAWKAFAAEGRFAPLTSAVSSPPTPADRTVYGAVATTVGVPAGKNIEVPFLLAWHYPNKYNAAQTWMGCHYATRWPDARAVMREAVTSFAALRERTERFRHDLLRQHAAVLAAGLRHGQRRHPAPYRGGVPHCERGCLWLGRLERLLRPDLHACLGL